MSGGYGPRRLVADVMAAAAGRGLCPVFAGGDVDRALAGARQVLAALHLPAEERPLVMCVDEVATIPVVVFGPIPRL